MTGVYRLNTAQYSQNTVFTHSDVGKLYKTIGYPKFLDCLVVKCVEVTDVSCVFEIMETYKTSAFRNNAEVGRKYHTCLKGKRGGMKAHPLDISEKLIIN